MNKRFVVITPCRDEAKYARKTLDSMLSQTVPPDKWVIVDDGSSDGTWEILREYSERVNFITVLRKKNRGYRHVGGGVVEAFNYGLNSINLNHYPYLCKMDLDLVIPERYFETILKKMERNPRIGTCSGKSYALGSTGQFVNENCGDETSLGMVKFYRRVCFDEIGGFVPHVMWDGIDCHRCRMKGWIACSWDDPEIRFTHLRPLGSSDKGLLRGRMRHGQGQYYMGTHITYMAASALKRMTQSPRILGGSAIFLGYLLNMIRRKQRYPDLAFRKFLRKYQWQCLFLGKKRATANLDARQESKLEIGNWKSP